MTEPSTTARLLRELHEVGGFSWRDIAHMVGGTPEYVRKISRTGAESPAYRDAVAQLAERGHVSSDKHVTRREQSLRTRAGEEPRRFAHPVAPPGGAERPHIEHALLGDGGRMVTVEVEPYRVGERGARRAGMMARREDARRQLMAAMRAAARERRRVAFQVGWGYDAGDPIEWQTIGGKAGYDARTVLALWSGEGDDPLSWLGDGDGDDDAGEARAVAEAQASALGAAGKKKGKGSPVLGVAGVIDQHGAIVAVSVLMWPSKTARDRRTRARRGQL